MEGLKMRNLFKNFKILPKSLRIYFLEGIPIFKKYQSDCRSDEALSAIRQLEFADDNLSFDDFNYYIKIIKRG
jgi:hypothetical protein